LPKSPEAEKNEKRIAIKERGIELTFLGTRGEIKIRSRRHFRHSALLVRLGHAPVMIDCGADWLDHRATAAFDCVLLTGT
jgi:hypothetical protein